MSDKSSDKTVNDALFILDALQHVTSTVIINAGEIAFQKKAKVNTIQKRFTTLKQRYPNLNIQTTSVGATAAPAKVRATRVTKPAKTSKKNGKVSEAKQAAVKAKVEEEEEEEDDEDGQMEEDANNQLEEGFVKQEDGEEDAGDV